MLKFLTEGTGTLILVLAIGLTTDPIAAGLILVTLLYIGFSITEVHFNPAVSLGVWTIGRNSSAELLIRFAGQFSGAIGGAFIVSWISMLAYIPKPAVSTGMAEFILLEILFSVLFVLLFLLLLYPLTEKKGSLSGLIIGLAFAGCYLVVEPVIGFGLHPALNTGFTLVDYVQGGISFSHLPIYFFSPLIAALLAAWAYKNVASRYA
ncbi:MIP family channel protein [soil metagenome]